ncbi:MAG: phenylalanine--tRNA ligase subunit beta [Minisyncoccales bacterium]|jgi:phenylalanyl-tRNA synthetase beta chain
MKFSYNWIASLIDGKIPNPKELSELLTMKLFEVDGMEEKDGDWIIDLDVLPSRAGDCLSHIGVAREVAVALNLEFKNPLFSDLTFNSPGIPVIISDPSDCPRYVALSVSQVKIQDSPDWIKQRLIVCGMQPINNIVDIANYVMLETGQPLHIFDSDKVSNEIIVRKARKGETITTLDNKKCFLDEKILLITDREKILGIAGIKGGKEAEVTKETKNIIIESASFNRKVIRKGSSILKIRTDASIRFEHGFDLNLNGPAILRASSLVTEIAGGNISNEITDISIPKPDPVKITFSFKQAEKLLGVSLDKKETLNIFHSLGFFIKKDEDDLLEVEVPTRRIDILIQEDLIEEVGRIIGYEKISAITPKIEIGLIKRNKRLFWEEKIKDLLVLSGFTEIYTHTLVNEIDVESTSNLLEVEGPVSREQKYLRPSLLPGVIKSAADNEKNYFKTDIFEVGKVYSKDDGEKQSLAIVSTGSFLELKGVLDLLLNELGIVADYKLNVNNRFFSERASVVAGGKKIGYIGTISEEATDTYNTNPNLSIIEMDIESMLNLAIDKKSYNPIPKYPETDRDISVIVPEETLFGDLIDSIKKEKYDLLRKVDFFDLYKGDRIPNKTKSFTLRLTFSGKRTLKTEEVNEIRDDIIKNLEKNKEWKIRR